MIRKIFFIAAAFFILILNQADSFAASDSGLPKTGYLSLPKNGGDSAVKSPGPALILIHEWWGLNSQIKGLADSFAEKGYAAYAVDLYEGKSAKDPMEAHELMRGLPEDRAYQTLKDAVAFLKSRRDVDPEKIGVIGWCMGGGYALELALQDPSVAAVVMYYGRLVTDEKRLAGLKAPLLGFFGAEDRGISKDSVEKFKADLERLGVTHDITIYPGAGHAFANPENTEGYRPEAAADAMKKTDLFLKQHLG